jgi:hypothetical protein
MILRNRDVVGGDVYIVVSAKNAYRDMFGKTSLEMEEGLALVVLKGNEALASYEAEEVHHCSNGCTWVDGA